MFCKSVGIYKMELVHCNICGLVKFMSSCASAMTSSMMCILYCAEITLSITQRYTYWDHYKHHIYRGEGNSMDTGRIYIRQCYSSIFGVSSLAGVMWLGILTKAL